MKQWIVAYQYWQIVFSRPEMPVAQGHVVFDDQVEAALSYMVKNKCNVWVRVHTSMRALVAHMMSRYLYVKAAGGLVRQGEKLLLIDRNQHWDMAKGKVEPGETLREAARREVMEETGLTHVECGPLALKTYHIYDLYGGWHLKQTSWFHMRSTDQQLTPQREEGIARAEWTPLPLAQERLSGSYSMMRLLSSQLQNNHNTVNT